jgi:hypothetical protein
MDVHLVAPPALSDIVKKIMETKSRALVFHMPDPPQI